jgi:hypothetical protein
MNKKTEEKEKSKQKSTNSKSIKYIFIVLIIIVAFFGVNKLLESNNTSLSASLFRSAKIVNGSTGEITKEGLDYYMENYGQNVDPTTVEAKRVDLGCHFEIHIFLNGELEMRLGYDGRIYEL